MLCHVITWVNLVFRIKHYSTYIVMLNFLDTLERLGIPGELQYMSHAVQDNYVSRIVTLSLILLRAKYGLRRLV